MHYWFQNLNEQKKKLFYFRGSVGSAYDKTWLKYEFCSGFGFGFEFEPSRHKTFFIFKPLLFTLYLTIYGLKIPFIKKGREYGFDIRNWEIWAHFGSRPMESSSKDPWYYTIVIRPLDLIFGKTIFFKKEIMSNYHPVKFSFRNKDYTMDKITIEKRFWIRPRIPFSLYSKEWTCMDIEIKNPPMRAGKGENSWDIDDTGTFGLSCEYSGPEPTFKNQQAVFEYCCQKYCEEVSKDIQRYGRSNDDRDLPYNFINFKYLGNANAKVSNSEA